MGTEDQTLIRVMGNGASQNDGYRLRNDTDEHECAIDFEPMHGWMTRQTSDGFPSTGQRVVRNDPITKHHCEIISRLLPWSTGLFVNAMRCCRTALCAIDVRTCN
jgi:hypothetical protein